MKKSIFKSNLAKEHDLIIAAEFEKTTVTSVTIHKFNPEIIFVLKARVDELKQLLNQMIQDSRSTDVKYKCHNIKCPYNRPILSYQEAHSKMMKCGTCNSTLLKYTEINGNSNIRDE